MRGYENERPSHFGAEVGCHQGEIMACSMAAAGGFNWLWNFHHGGSSWFVGMQCGGNRVMEHNLLAVDSKASGLPDRYNPVH